MRLSWKEKACKATNLARVLSALQEAQAHHVAGDLPGIGIEANSVRQDGSFQTLQELREAGCWEQEWKWKRITHPIWEISFSVSLPPLPNIPIPSLRLPVTSILEEQLISGGSSERFSSTDCSLSDTSISDHRSQI